MKSPPPRKKTKTNKNKNKTKNKRTTNKQTKNKNTNQQIIIIIKSVNKSSTPQFALDVSNKDTDKKWCIFDTSMNHYTPI